MSRGGGLCVEGNICTLYFISTSFASFVHWSFGSQKKKKKREATGHGRTTRLRLCWESYREFESATPNAPVCGRIAVELARLGAHAKTNSWKGIWSLKQDPKQLKDHNMWEGLTAAPYAGSLIEYISWTFEVWWKCKAPWLAKLAGKYISGKRWWKRFLNWTYQVRTGTWLNIL